MAHQYPIKMTTSLKKTLISPLPYVSTLFVFLCGGRHGHDRMVVGFTISTYMYHH